MAELDILDSKNNKVGTVELSPVVFEGKVNQHLVHQYVNMQLAGRRRGTACTKSSYGQLAGANKKPWKQKGTGRARAGKSRSALWRGGLTIFGPTPRSFAFQMSKKSKKNALRSVLSDRLQNNLFCIVDKVDLEQPKTKQIVQWMKEMGLPEKTLFVLSEKNPNLELAVRNLPRVDVLQVEGLNAFDLLNHEKIVCTPESIKKIEERLG